MGGIKGKNNFSAYQLQRLTAVENGLAITLHNVPKGMIFRDIHSLLSYLSSVPEIGVHRTTLRRNSRYWGIVLKYFSAQPGGAYLVETREAAKAIEQVRELTASVEIQNLKNHVRRLEAFIQNRSVSPSPSTSLQTTRADSATSKYETKFALTAKALLLLLNAIEVYDLGICLDEKTGEIVDNNAWEGTRVLVSAGTLKDFLAWKKENESIVLSFDRGSATKIQ